MGSLIDLRVLLRIARDLPNGNQDDHAPNTNVRKSRPYGAVNVAGSTQLFIGE
jgi:hypothetical protein